MSKRPKVAAVSDLERTCIMRDLVHRQYHDYGGPHPDSGILSHVVIDEVAPQSGSSGPNRYADVVALGVWPSKGMELEGYELKASRADLRRELENLEKHRAVARYCDKWWLVAWDERVLETGREIPEEWGILVTVDNAGVRELKELRKATKQAEPLLWSKPFVCSLIRNAHQQSPGASYVARACETAAIPRIRKLLEPLNKFQIGRAHV